MAWSSGGNKKVQDRDPHGVSSPGHFRLRVNDIRKPTLLQLVGDGAFQLLDGRCVEENYAVYLAHYFVERRAGNIVRVPARHEHLPEAAVDGKIRLSRSKEQSHGTPPN
jgi:hypothetical protein